MEEFDYGTFKMAYDKDPIIQALVHRFDTNGVELETKAQKDQNVRAVEKEKDSKVVNQMAKSATKRAMADRWQFNQVVLY